MIKNKLRTYYLSLLVILIAGTSLYASGTAGVSGADFLEIPIGSRASAMGDAYTAATGEVNTLYFNPAGLASLRYPMLSVQHQELILDSRLENVTFAWPLFDGYIGASHTLFWVPPFEKIDIDGNNVGDITFLNGVLTAGYGYDLKFLYAGAVMKYIYQVIDGMQTHSVAFDVGLLKGLYMYSPFDAPVRNFFIGLSFLNLGSNAGGAPLPRQLRFGLSYKLTHWFTFNVDIVENIISGSDFYDFIYGFDEGFRVNFGAEVTYLDMIFLRTGLRLNDGGMFSVGVGFNYAIKNVSCIIDTAYSDSGIFGPNYSINLSFKLIPKVVTYEDRVEATKHYRSGLKYYVANDIDSALKEFKVTRDFNPYYKNINRKIDDLQEIKKLMEENKRLDEELKKNQ